MLVVAIGRQRCKLTQIITFWYLQIINCFGLEQQNFGILRKREWIYPLAPSSPSAEDGV